MEAPYTAFSPQGLSAQELVIYIRVLCAIEMLYFSHGSEKIGWRAE